ncbi:MAG: VOC family protein [Anaerolineales bacterium]|nr:VOC family protein [Anaerolineales bacterium]
MDEKFQVIGLRFPTFYLKNFEKAVAFYAKIFGPAPVSEPRLKGWKLGDTWLTFFPAEGMNIDPNTNPRNAEFAIQVGEPEQVDILYKAFLEAGAKTCMAPEDTKMYDKMRFCAVDDPFGIRVDVYCPLSSD